IPAGRFASCEGGGRAPGGKHGPCGGRSGHSPRAFHRRFSTRLAIGLGVAACAPNLDRNFSGFIDEGCLALCRAKDMGRDRTRASPWA
ncbi:MAG: hypothetical protein ACLFRG_23145, partial [Desulfococcaceae bacterium]